MEQLSIRNITDAEILIYGLNQNNKVIAGNLIAHEQSILKVRCFYTVAHVLIEQEHGRQELVPVNPFLHADKQFTDAPAHLHVDGRFEYAPIFHCDDGLTLAAVFMPGTCKMIGSLPDHNYNSICGEKYYIKELLYIRKRCKRLTTGLRDPSRARKYEAWAKSMLGKSCAGKKCPHYGTTMIDRGDHLYCPLHNLIGSKETEVIIENKLFIKE